MILEKENIDLHEYVEKYDNFLENHWTKRFEDFVFVAKKEKTKDDKIKESITLLEENNSILRDTDTIFHLNHEVINNLKQALSEVEGE